MGMTERDIVRALEGAGLEGYDDGDVLRQAFEDAAIAERGAE